MKLCDGNCNECPIIMHPNSRMVTRILNMLHEKFGDDAYVIVQSHCPNLTCCYDCGIDDFCHDSDCILPDPKAKVKHRYGDDRGVYVDVEED